MDKISPIRVLPVLMIVAAICFGMRFSEVIASKGLSAAEFSSIAPAAGTETPTAAMASAKSEMPPSQSNLAANDVAPSAPSVEGPDLGAPPAPSRSTGGNWKGADDLDDEYSGVQMELFSDLAKRRKDIETKERELSMREALLKAGQAELEQKYQELTTIKADIEELLKKQTVEEDKRIVSLVKIYEGMKAKDAARIFDTLDMDVLLQVMVKMSERKSAPIIAAMDAEKARNVTIMLAEQNKLPSLPALPGALAN
jgi:flagellar motility protein MotE (MotC chaperone)